MDSRENLHVVSLGNANFSAAMSNVGSLRKDCVLRTPDPVKARDCNIGIGALIFQKEMVAIDCLKF